MCGSSFWWIWLWGGCSEIVKRSEVMSVANDPFAGYERGMQKSNPESSDSRIRPRHLTQGAFCFAASDRNTPFSNAGNRNGKKSSVLSPSLGFVGQGMHTESGDRSQLRRSHWQQLPFNAPGILA
jgi:hypothetical protein